MKLKEKLAREYADPEWWDSELRYPMNYVGEAFLAGFEKSREMAAGILWRELNDRTPAAGMAFIKNIGEEEV